MNSRRHLIVEQAEVFLRAHPSDSVSLGDLCRVTGVCERTLRNAFQGVHGSSPKRYIMRTRLEEVHKALQRQSQTTVTTVATDYGFTELGRFASMYKATFGECPSTTLRAHI
jgi:transcriptional regulator GlxA family with amidase domain